jgi:hypothetical protein
MKFIWIAVACLLIPRSLFSAEMYPESTDPYEILGVDPGVSDRELVDVWKSLMKKHHPDSGGQVTIAQNISEAFQFLKGNRIDYDRGILPFRGEFKKTQTHIIPYTQEEEWGYRFRFIEYLRQESRARDLAKEEGGPIFLHYAIMNLAGDHLNYGKFKSWRLRAYSELLFYLGLEKLNRSELAGFVLRDPVKALKAMLEHYDNFNIRFSTLNDLFFAYEKFYLREIPKSAAFLNLIESLAANGLIYDHRFSRVRERTVKSLKAWLGFYLASPREFRMRNKRQYKSTRRLLMRLEPFPRNTRSCFYLLLGIPPAHL